MTRGRSDLLVALLVANLGLGAGNLGLDVANDDDSEEQPDPCTRYTAAGSSRPLDPWRDDRCEDPCR